MVVFLGLNGVLAKTSTAIEVMPASLESVKTLLSYKEIDLWIISTLSEDEESWVRRHFPELGEKIINLATNEMKVDVLIDVENRLEGFSGRFLKFDSRNPNFSWGNIIKEVKTLLKNSRELTLKTGWYSGVELINSSKVKIKKIILERFSHEFTDEGPIHLSEDLDVYENIESGESILLSETSMFKTESVSIEYCEWEDGEIIEDLYLSIKC